MLQLETFPLELKISQFCILGAGCDLRIERFFLFEDWCFKILLCDLAATLWLKLSYQNSDRLEA